MKLKNIAYGVFIAVATAAFVIGSGGPSQAKHKKKMEAPPPPGPICFDIYKPVCAVKGGMKFTYANSCYADKDGAKIMSDKACPAMKAKAHKKHGKKKMAKPAKKKEMKKM